MVHPVIMQIGVFKTQVEKYVKCRRPKTKLDSIRRAWASQTEKHPKNKFWSHPNKKKKAVERMG